MNQELLAQLKGAQQRFDENRSSIPKIQRVPVLLRQNDRFAKYYSPKMISFGPIHHGTPFLQQGEHYKLLWTSKFVAKYNENEDTDRTAQILLKRIEDNIEELKKQFAEDVIWKYGDNDLASMLFVDGCSLLHFMENVDKDHPEALNLKLDQLMYMWRDMELLENQLPRRLLEMLSKEEGANLEYLFSNHHSMGISKRYRFSVVLVQNPNPIHILDFARSAFLSPKNLKLIDTGTNNQMEINITPNQQDVGDEHNNQKDLSSWHTYKNIRDLKKAGIRVMPTTSSDGTWNDIHFTSKWFSGELRLPVFVFNDVTPYFFRNLVAYEMCPDVGYKYECCSFFSFMDSLIDNGEDVKELRLSGVFQNLLGSDEDVANLFNDLGDDLPTKIYSDKISNDSVAFSKKYIVVKQQIEEHYSSKWRTWLAEAYNTHFNTPWATITFLAASLALILTFIQTWFSVHPK
ncbi:UPF0481 protein, partial [Mucuna pruriens]